jgi:hypothetical protein
VQHEVVELGGARLGADLEVVVQVSDQIWARTAGSFSGSSAATVAYSSSSCSSLASSP